MDGVSYRQSRLERLPGGLELRTFKGEDGSIQRIVTKTVPYRAGHRMYFALAPSKAIEGWGQLPMGSWVYWDGETMAMYVSSDFAQFLTLNNVFIGILCGIVAVLPIGGLAGVACMTIAGLTAALVSYYDSTGNPGFAIRGTQNPLKAWVEP